MYDFETPFMFEEVNIINFVYCVKAGEKFDVHTHGEVVRALPGMYIITSPKEEIGVSVMAPSDFHNEYQHMVEEINEPMPCLDGIWRWRDTGYRGDKWLKKPKPVIMFRTPIPLTIPRYDDSKQYNLKNG